MEEFKINKIEKILFIVIIVLTILTSLFNLDYFFLYIMGFIFVAAGIFVTIRLPFFGLIFLITHSGIAGLSILQFAMGNVLSFLKSPVLSDGNVDNIYTYLGIALSLFILSIFLLVTQNIYNGVMLIKKKKMIVTYGLIGVYMLFFAFLMLQILPYIYMYIIK